MLRFGWSDVIDLLYCYKVSSLLNMWYELLTSVFALAMETTNLLLIWEIKHFKKANKLNSKKKHILYTSQIGSSTGRIADRFGCCSKMCFDSYLLSKAETAKKDKFTAFAKFNINIKRLYWVKIIFLKHWSLTRN